MNGHGTQLSKRTLTLLTNCESRPRPGPITIECILGSHSWLISDTAVELSLTSTYIKI